MRSFRGDLRHDPQHPGCSFVLELATSADQRSTILRRSTMQPIRLLLLDDHILFREGLRRRAALG